MVVIGQLGQCPSECTKSAQASFFCLHLLFQCSSEFLVWTRGVFKDTGCWVDHLFEAALIPNSHEANVLHDFGQQKPSFCEEVLDSSGKPLHDVWLHSSHETKVQEGKAAILREDQVAGVRICVNKAGEDQRRHTSLHGHVHHLHSFFLALYLLKFAPMDPFQGQDASGTLRSGILGQPLRCCDKRQKAMFLQKELSVVSLVVVVELLKDALCYFVCNLRVLITLTSPIHIQNHKPKGPAGPI
mmetsp:Transcript_48017/g.76441  ORF Transcript_48017/g.76441 Transcript_48017/m.76441 type:complete len:243 (-) Transcript_48017:814-1542(-)